MRSTSRTKPSPRKTKFNNSGGDWFRARAATSFPQPSGAGESPREGRRRQYRSQWRELSIGLPFRPSPSRPPSNSTTPFRCRERSSRHTPVAPKFFCEIGSSARCRPNSAHWSLAEPQARQRPASFSCTGQFLASPRERNHFVGRLNCEQWEYGVFTPPDLGCTPTFVNPGCSVKLQALSVLGRWQCRVVAMAILPAKTAVNSIKT